MATIPDGPMWWDREVDEQGSPIRADARQAARELWPEAVKRAQRTLGDPAEAVELMEAAVVHISRHFDRANAPPSAPNVFSLLSLHFCQQLRRRAKKLGRIKLVGTGESIEECAVVDGWADRINRQIDFRRICCQLNDRSRTIVAMRVQDHDWKLIADKLGIPSPTIRRAFWRDVREVLSRLGCVNGTQQKGKK